MARRKKGLSLQGVEENRNLPWPKHSPAYEAAKNSHYVQDIEKAKSHPGATRINEVGALCWTELYTNDMNKAVAFYTSLFDWTGKPWDSPTPYTVLTFKGQDKMAGGVLQMTKDMQGMPPHWLPYFQVEDTDKVVARAKELGGNVIVPPMDIPNVGRMATITDPQGAAFAVIKLPSA